MMRDPKDSLRELGTLVHEALPDLEDPFELSRGERRIVATLTGTGRESRRPWRRAFVVGASALATAALIAFVGLAHLRGPSATYVVRGAAVANGYVAAPDQSASIDFSDGSEVRLASGGAARIESFEQDRAVLVLEQGTAHVRVVHRPATKWTIRCGAYLVSIRGTEFDIAWSRPNETLRIDLYSGSIAVEGGTMPSEFVLLQGQRATLDREGVQIARIPATESAALESSAAPALEGRPAPPPDGSPTGRVASGDTAPPGDSAAADAPQLPAPSEPSAALPGGTASSDKAVRSWAASVQAGQYDEVLDQARALGIDSALRRASSRDLQALADAARYRRVGDIARRAYLALRERFPGSEPAKQAAWMLGRLSEESAPAEALAWFERYRSESPRGAYAGEALGRAMLVSERTKQHPRARELAQRYLQEQAGGPFSGSASKILSAP